jgi:IS30 family transposase
MKTKKHGAAWTDEERQRVVKLFQSGATILDIAEQLGRSDSSILRRLIDAGVIEDMWGWTTDKPQSASSVEPRTTTKQVIVPFVHAYETIYAERYWAGRNALRGQGNRQIVSEFDALYSFLERQLSSARWEAYMLYALELDKKQIKKTTARPLSLVNVERLAAFKKSIAPVAPRPVVDEGWIVGRGE